MPKVRHIKIMQMSVDNGDNEEMDIGDDDDTMTVVKIRMTTLTMKTERKTASGEERQRVEKKE